MYKYLIFFSSTERCTRIVGRTR